MMTELLPCPFCGGEAMLHTDKGPTGELYGWVGCNTCDVVCGHCDLRSMQPEEIHPEVAWNTRTPAPVSDNAMKVVAIIMARLRGHGIIHEDFCAEQQDEFEAYHLTGIIQQYGDQCRAEADAAGFRRGVEAAAADPTEAQWGGLARDIMTWLDFGDKTPRGLFTHLKLCGRSIPDWLRNEPEMQQLDHVPSKGTRCVLIYKAMVLALLETQENG